jgi:Cu2+-exporting ATPase/Cu+-exporting ATPase
MSEHIFDVRGMHCASCSLVIGKKLRKIPGVTNAEVNYATEKARVDFSPEKTSLQAMNADLQQLGYSLSPVNNQAQADHSQHLGLATTKEIKIRELELLQAKTHFVLPITLLVFVLMMWEIAARTFSFVPNFPVPMGLFTTISLILSSIVLFWIGQPFILGVSRFIRFRVANMDTLVGVGTLTAFLYSATITLLPSLRQRILLPEYTYFDVVLVVIGFVTLGKYLEARSKLRTGEAIEKLVGLQAKTALVLRDGKEVEIPIDQVRVGDHVIVKPGSKIPVDGVMLEGTTAVDEAMVTGESLPVDKKVGDMVIGSTINKQGSIIFKATKIGADTLLSQIVRFVQEAQGSKAPIEALADNISSIFVPVVLGLAFLSMVLWLAIGIPFLGQQIAVSYAITSFVGILIIACPCALGLATPTAIIVGVGKGAEYGILIKDAESLQRLSKVTTVMFDKTGTLTKGVPEVTDVVLLDPQISEPEVIRLAASVEKKSEHPLAEAIVRYAHKKEITFGEVTDFISEAGVGVVANVDGVAVRVRKPSVKDSFAQMTELQKQGKTVVVLEKNNTVLGYIALSDTLKEGIAETIAALRKKGLSIVLLTGDNALAASFIAHQAGISMVFSEVTPQEKALKIKELQSQGQIVAMAGDGVNDAPALAQANVGIAMATGTDVAIESAGVTLLHGDIHKVGEAIMLSKATMRTIKQNLFWAFIFNVIGIPLAGGAFYPLFGWLLSPVFAGLAMAFSSVSVVTNSLRLKTKKL